MSNPRRWTSVVTAVLALGIAEIAGAQDWPQWRGVERNGKVTGFTAPAAWPTALTPKWKVTVGAGDATPALVGDRLYVSARQGEEEVTLCLSAADGQELWRDKLAAAAVPGPAGSHGGPRSSPAVAEGKVVTLGVTGVLSCLDAASGKLIWRKDPFPNVVPKFHTAMSPLILDGQCIAHLGGAGNGAVIAYDLTSGEPTWQWPAEGPDYASPALLTVAGTKQIVTLTEKSLVGLDVADGRLLWQLPFVPQGRAYNAATPIVDGQTVYFTGAARGTTAVKIEKQGEVFVATELWKNPTVAVQFSTPVLKDGLLFGLSDRGNLFCINAQSGQTAWVDSTARGRGFGAMLDAGSVLFALPNSGELLVFQPSDKAYTEVAKLKLADSATYAHPVVAGNRLFIKDESTLALYLIE